MGDKGVFYLWGEIFFKKIGGAQFFFKKNRPGYFLVVGHTKVGGCLSYGGEKKYHRKNKWLWGGFFYFSRKIFLDFVIL